ncbi:MAG: hypothetical protein OER88_06055 [Planctomycetota bacterium]|nr:hypothetical protein [Planctomycetota bacterium]
MRQIPCLLLFFLTVALAQDARSPFVDAGRIVHEPVDETSGIVRSPTYPGVFWVHNDSGDEPRLFAIDATGKALLPDFLKDRFHVGTTGEAKEAGKKLWPGLKLLLAANIDWEDIALADGKLYVADVGNNGNARRDLGVYVVNEPNPRARDVARPLTHLPVRFSDQTVYPAKEWHFDCEAVFVSDGKLYFLTKHRANRQHNRGAMGTKLYRLDTAFTDKENVLTKIDTHERLAMPTAADLSPDGTKLAVLCVNALFVFEKPASGDKWLSEGKVRAVPLPRKRTKQAEAVCWEDDATLLVANEQRDLFRVKLAAITAYR